MKRFKAEFLQKMGGCDTVTEEEFSALCLLGDVLKKLYGLSEEEKQVLSAICIRQKEEGE